MDLNTRTDAPRRGPLRLVTRTLGKSWNDNIVSEAAEAAFWQTLSLPPLLLGLLGSLGFMSDWFGPAVARSAQEKIIAFCNTIFSDNVVDQIITPTVGDILTRGHSEIVSIAFLISLWAGSSAMASFIDAITVAHGQYGVRNTVWQRIVALLTYIVALVIGVVTLPAVALGPDTLISLLPGRWTASAEATMASLYYPTTGALLVIGLTTLYKIALPRKLRWHRLLPGAVLAMLVFLLSSGGLRHYISILTSTGYTYGALATPIAFLLFTFCIGLAVVLGAQFNNAVQELYPARASRRDRRRWRRLEAERRGHAEPDAEPGAGAGAGAGATLMTAPSPADILPTIELGPGDEPTADLKRGHHPDRSRS